VTFSGGALQVGWNAVKAVARSAARTVVAREDNKIIMVFKMEPVNHVKILASKGTIGSVSRLLYA